ncbi:MAG: hypothetical protein KAX30_07860 [Candidatus Atribacteria bacterium]|nr:hypothetical protein [Candidatus Atribacteria bacterium]
MGVFNPDKVDFILRRTISKQIVDGVMQHKADTSVGEIVYAGADDTLDENYKFILGMFLKAKKTIIPFHVQLFKEG